MKKWFDKKKKDNKGFTLVELVVVIAILALLVGILTPQYTKYVDKARKSSDASNLGNMVKAVEIAAADPAGKLKPGTITIKINDDGASVTLGDGDTSDNQATAQNAIKETMGDEALTTVLKSKAWGDTDAANEISATIAIDNDYSFNVTYSANVADYINTNKTAASTPGAQ